MANTTRALQAGLAAGFLGLLVCIVLISQSELRRPVSLASVKPVLKEGKAGKAGAKAKKAGGGSFVLNYLKSNQDVDEHAHKDPIHALTQKQIRKEGRSNADDLVISSSGLQTAVGPDGLSDPGDVSDIALLNQLSGENAMDTARADAADYQHRAAFDTSLGFSSLTRTHDMEHAAAAADARVTLGTAGGGRFSSMASADAGNVDALGTSSDADVFSEVAKATAEPSRQDVHLASTARAAGLTTMGAAASSNLVGAGGDSEAEAMADPRHNEVLAAQAEAAGDSKGIWMEPGSGKNGDSFALDSIQVKSNA